MLNTDIINGQKEEKYYFLRFLFLDLKIEIYSLLFCTF